MNLVSLCQSLVIRQGIDTHSMLHGRQGIDTQYAPRPSRYWRTEHAPRASMHWHTQYAPRLPRHWHTQYAPRPSRHCHTHHAPRPSRHWHTQYAPRPSRHWHTQYAPRPSRHWHTQYAPRPSRHWHTQYAPRPSKHWHTQYAPRPSRHWHTVCSTVLLRFVLLILHALPDSCGSSIHIFQNYSADTRRRPHYIYWSSVGETTHNTPVPYSAMHYSEQKCTHFCCEWCIVGTDALLDLRDWSITTGYNRPLFNSLSRVAYLCVDKLTITGSDNGMSPGRHQAIIWTNAGMLLIASLGTNFSEIPIRIQTFPFKRMHLKMSSAKWRPFCLGLSVLTTPKHAEARTTIAIIRMHYRDVIV